jgi:serine/threonine-protein kinase
MAGSLAVTNVESRRRRLNRYELLAEIASGGMGSVLLARLGGAGGFERLFAIKVMHPHLTSDPQFVGMLLDEARVAARIHHPNVVATVDVGQHESFHYIVMDYVDGFPLARILDGAPFNRKERIRIVNRLLLDAMSGLTAAHTLRDATGARLGIVHRDVSPQNILIGTDGVGRLTDFGIALAASQLAVSQADPIRGKPSYLAPEQAAGKEVDLRADLWALGVVLWEGITGQRLFVADTEAATIEKVLSEPIPSPAAYFPDLPAELEALCLRALDRDPAQRPSSAREFAFELEHFAQEAALLADTHEVSDLLQSRLGVEIEGRRRAIQRYVSEVGGETAPATLRDVHGLPKLSEDALPPSARQRAPERLPVGLSTLPAARLLRTTPAATASETSPSKPRTLSGVFALFGLFVLGSITTLGLLHFRILNEVAPELAPLSADVDRTRRELTAAAAGLLPKKSGSEARTAPAAREGDALAEAVERAGARSSAETSARAPSAGAAPAAVRVASPPAALAMGTPAAGKRAARPVTEGGAQAARENPPVRRNVASDRVVSGAPRVRARDRRAQPENVPVLPVEENPYRLK